MGRKQRGVTAVSPALKHPVPAKEAVAETPKVVAAPVAVVADPYAGLSNAAKVVAQAFDGLDEADANAFIAHCITTKEKV